MYNFNIAPKNVFRGTNSDGTKFRVNEYDFETYANIEVGKFILGIFAFGAIAPFMSPLLFLIALWNFNGRFKIEYLLCIFLSSYFLFDAYNGWLLTLLTRLAFNSESEMNMLLGLNGGIILSSLFLLILGAPLASFMHNLKFLILRWIVIILIVGLSMGVGYGKVYMIALKHPDWLDRNLEMGKYTPAGSYSSEFK